MKYINNKDQGFSLVEVVIVAAVSTLVFGALLMSFRYSLELMNVSRAKLSALSVANDRMEFFRSLPYNDVGVLAGFPAGIIPQNSTTSLNNIIFYERVLVDYVNDPGDDIAGVDGNGITTDYKKIKVEYTWSVNGATSSIALVSNIVPRSIETDVGGGTVRVNVFDQDANLLPGASVTLINNTLSPIINIPGRATGPSGAATFAAPAGSDYEVIVTANIGGNPYSTTQTFQPTIAVPNSDTPPFTLLEADISTVDFQIGELSDFNLITYSSIIDGIFREEFSSLAAVADSTDVATTGGDLVLADTAGVYQSSGIVYLGPFTPVTLESWHSARIAIDVPSNTSHFVRFYTGVAPGPFTIIPNGDLPGNSIGFTTNSVDISSLDPLIYPTIVPGITLVTTDTSLTPAVDEFSVFYNESNTTLNNANFDIRGNKTIGTDSASLPVYKYTDSLTTDGIGELTISDLEFDDYTLNFAGLDIATACSEHPVIHTAGVDTNVALELVSSSVNTLRVIVTDLTGNILPGVEVDLSRPGYSSATEVTNNCGQVFFTGGLVDEIDYEVEINAAGFNTENLTDVSINGNGILVVTLTD